MCGGRDISRPVYILNSIIVKFKQQLFDPGLPGKFSEAVDLLEKVFEEENASGAKSVIDQMVSSYEMMVDDDGKPNEFLADVLMQHWDQLVSLLDQVPVVKERQAAAKVPQRVFFIEPSVRIEEKNIDLLLASAKKLDQLGNSFFSLREQLSNVELPPEVQRDLRTAVSSLTFLCQDIFQTIVKLKLVSPEPFLEKSRKMIIALAETCGKKVDISFSCKNLMVERRISSCWRAFSST
jgi:chemotaxis protein histidine kinase CheA